MNKSIEKKLTPEFPLKHISIRVPWHDTGWHGVVCKSPNLNGACVRLQRIAEHKNENNEMMIAGQSLEQLPTDKWPCCVDERVAFMAPFEMVYIKKHALASRDSKNYGHFVPTSQRCPMYSAGVVPFFWMMRKNIKDICERFGIDVSLEREPELGYESTWIHNYENQKALLDTFSAQLRKDDSLCLFYAKHVPFFEGTGRILIGVGRIKDIGQIIEYEKGGDGLRSMVWERPIQHSIRPRGTDGFLMPYHELLERAANESFFDFDQYVARVQSEHWNEFSYGSELVTHDGAIAALLSMDGVLSRMKSCLGISTDDKREWIHNELIRLWKVRGPYPGLGAILSAFGLSRGVFVAHALQQKAGDNADPWPLVEQVFKDPSLLLTTDLRRDIKELAPTWQRLSVERKKFLRLVSRFELTIEQAKKLYDTTSRQKAKWYASDSEIIQNPYRIFEMSRHDLNAVGLLTIDRGVFPYEVVGSMHPLDTPSQLESAVDLRRVRAFTVDSLEKAAESGHTLLPKGHLIEAINDYTAHPACPVTGDILETRAPDMLPEVVTAPFEDNIAFQLKRYSDIGALVRKQVEGRINGVRHKVDCNWEEKLKEKFGIAQDVEEERARREKFAALKELAEARFSVLTGPAGAGKTTVLNILCAHDEIKREGILLLAPTGKARVRMLELIGRNGAEAYTIAQFLYQSNRYDPATTQYHLSDSPKVTRYGTVIVDESSMLTEDMIGALFDAFHGVKRFIFVGDIAQLSPIGAGRPFVDIVAYLRPKNYESIFPRVASGYTELTVERRQVGVERPDLRLARWFSAASPTAGEDDILESTVDEHTNLNFIAWDTAEDFQQKLDEVLIKELKLDSVDDIRGFNRSLGANIDGQYDYFNVTRGNGSGLVKNVEKWQILSPLRNVYYGVTSINRAIHTRYRADFLKLASSFPRHIPAPLGAERVVYGDKVINLRNHKKNGFPEEGLNYLANGEIGIAVGQWKTNRNPKYLNIEFASQQGITYGFTKKDFKEEGEPSLELAYALTIHKAQGSQFNLVILVLPKEHLILSRELLYTALTRHQDRIVVLYQGSRTTFKEYAAPHRSESARRMTNLLVPCRMQEIRLAKGSVFMQEGLIHRTSTGIAVRSKSELIIYEALISAGVRPEYEKPLTLNGCTRYPDFTIEDEISGRVVYWEHLGLLEREGYKRSWDAKLAWYREGGVLPAGEGAGVRGMLITSSESSAVGFNVSEVQEKIRKFLN